MNAVEELKKSTVHIKNRDEVEEIISGMIKDGAQKLQVISDFDHTMSRVHLNGGECGTTYGILKQEPFTDEQYRMKSSLLFKHYHPIEMDPFMTRAEKIPYMLEWYTKCVNLIPTSGMKKENLQKMVLSSSISLRDKCDEVLKLLHEHDVPLLIFSAGIGDFLKEVLKQQSLLFSNIKVIANFLQYDEKNTLLGFEGDVIHTFNKNQNSISNSDYFQTLKPRSNVVLMGDSLGDVDMSEGAENVDSILRIGFLNYKIEESLPVYMDAYDIVLADDQTMDVPLGILDCIL